MLFNDAGDSYNCLSATEGNLNNISKMIRCQQTYQSAYRAYICYEILHVSISQFQVIYHETNKIHNLDMTNMVIADTMGAQYACKVKYTDINKTLDI